MRTGLLLILALGLLSLIGTLLVQAPAGLATDPAAYTSWLASIHSKYGGWTPVFDKLGFFAVFTSIWFKAIMVLLTTSVLACSVNRAPRLWKLAFHPRTRMGETFFTHAPLRASVLVPAEPDETMDYVREVLKSHRFRTITDPDDDGLNLYADRFRWGPFGTVMAHLSFVIILLGFFLSATTGFKNTQLIVPVGSTVQVGNGTGLSVKAMSFNDAYYPDGSPSDYASDLILYKNGAQVDRQTIRVNHPMKAGGVSFYQSFFGEAAAMKVTDGAGKTLYDDAAALQWQSDDGKHSIGKFDIKAKGLTVYVIDVASGKTDPNIKAGQLQLEVDQAGKRTHRHPGRGPGQADDDRRPDLHLRTHPPVHRPDRGPRPRRALRLGRLDAAGARALHGLLLPAPPRVGADPQDLWRQRGPVRFHHQARPRIQTTVPPDHHRHPARRSPVGDHRQGRAQRCLSYRSTA